MSEKRKLKKSLLVRLDDEQYAYITHHARQRDITANSLVRECLAGAGPHQHGRARGRWMDNVFIEQFWRSLKYECVYLYAFETDSELRASLAKWIGHYNSRRPRSALSERTPDKAYHGCATTPLPRLTPVTVSVSNNEKLAA